MTSQKHILVIDDDPVSRRLFGAKLADLGFNVLYAQNGEQGRETARRFHPDLILLDIKMPIMDGYKTAERLRSEKETADIPIVFLTNEDLSLEAEKVLKEAWNAEYLHKGIDMEKFGKRIKKILGTKKE